MTLASSDAAFFRFRPESEVRNYVQKLRTSCLEFRPVGVMMTSIAAFGVLNAFGRARWTLTRPGLLIDVPAVAAGAALDFEL